MVDNKEMVTESSAFSRLLGNGLSIFSSFVGSSRGRDFDTRSRRGGGEVNSRCESILLPLIRKLKVACTLPAQRDSPSPIYFSIISGKKRQS